MLKVVPADLRARMDEKRSVERAVVLSEGRWTHNYPITVEASRALGIEVSTDMPRAIYDLMDLYPQTGGVGPSVWYVSMRRAAEAPPAARIAMP